jgi:hypothetical protein
VTVYDDNGNITASRPIGSDTVYLPGGKTITASAASDFFSEYKTAIIAGAAGLAILALVKALK